MGSLPQRELQYVQSRLTQLQDTVKLINTTVHPDVFFKHLNFALDILLDLQQYEKYKIFNGAGPSADYCRILQNLESTVDDFIDRAVAANQRKLDSLKTENAKIRNCEDFAIKLISAFDASHSFWTGSFSQSRVFPHYTGPLYTKHNYRRVLAIYDSLDNGLSAKESVPLKDSQKIQPMYCGNCGKKIIVSGAYCAYCGQKI